MSVILAIFVAAKLFLAAKQAGSSSSLLILMEEDLRQAREVRLRTEKAAGGRLPKVLVFHFLFPILAFHFPG